MYDVLIVGGGVVGCAIARELSRYALKIALLERESDVGTGATKANSAIVHGGYAEAHSKLKGRLCYQGRTQFARLDRELGFGFSPTGSLVLAFEEGQRDALVALMENGRRNGLDDLSLLDGGQVRAMEPAVNPAVAYGLHCKGAGVCSPYELAIALMENAMVNGAALFLQAEVASVVRLAQGFQVRTADGRCFYTKYLVNAAGLGAASISAMAGDSRFILRPRSGEYLVMAKGTGKLVRSVLFQMPTAMGKGILVAPTVYGNLLIGPDALDGENDDRSTHPDRLRHILAGAMRTTDRLNVQQFIRSFAGVRSVADTDDFIIDASTVPGLIQAAGIQSPGLTASPAIALLVRDLLDREGLRLVEKKDFNPNRRAFLRPLGVSMAEAARRAALEEGVQGRLICRCEQVLEAAVEDAAGRGIPLYTVDAVKRRTRAGMGWCQGAFCGPRLASLLSRRYDGGIDPRTDAQRQGLTRVGREELLAYLKEHPL